MDLIGLLNCLILAVILVLLGAIVAWVASAFQWPIPWNIQRLYLLVVLLIFLVCYCQSASDANTVRNFRHAGTCR